MAAQKKKQNSRAARQKQANKPLPSNKENKTLAPASVEDTNVAVVTKTKVYVATEAENQAAIDKVNAQRSKRTKFAWTLFGISISVIVFAIVNFIWWIVASKEHADGVKNVSWMIWSQTNLIFIVAGLLSALVLYNNLGLIKGNNDSVDVNLAGALSILVGSILVLLFGPVFIDLSNIDGLFEENAQGIFRSSEDLAAIGNIEWALISLWAVIGIVEIIIGVLELGTKTTSEFHDAKLIEREIAADVLNVSEETISKIDSEIDKTEAKPVKAKTVKQPAKTNPNKKKAKPVKK